MQHVCQHSQHLLHRHFPTHTIQTQTATGLFVKTLADLAFSEQDIIKNITTHRALTEEEMLGNCCGVDGCKYIFQAGQDGASFVYALASTSSVDQAQFNNMTGLMVIKYQTSCVSSVVLTSASITVDFSDNSLDKCVRYCVDLGYNNAFVLSTTCKCHTSAKSTIMLSCDTTPCPGNQSQLCGNKNLGNYKQLNIGTSLRPSTHTSHHSTPI